ncbi:glycerophosphodiester phosphodiesterase [Spirosoma oryzicola]|uniref:glycerophosphodiester phosphodiesterase n=1 Tax=Spirosoma oryzicola TaxID=2898794 RepID=UPI001E55581A|nr:glycerophosphodiester phosphodiesterase family protein [Spirosoma oryzicola]UHG89979.1 glycerophosphodiester phosphodiesterase [Spirosoma oryzicola]
MVNFRITVLNLLLTSCLSHLAANAQHTLSLSNYTYSPTQTAVGTLRATGPVSRLSLRGPNAGLFTLNKSNQLAISPKAAKTATPWYDLIVEGQTASGSVRDTFRIVKDEFIRNQVIAHRGAWKQTKTSENSITALQNAIRLGCMGSEFDVHMSADSVLFVNHDATIQGLAIEKTPSSELAKIKLSNGEPLPTLEAYLTEGMKQNRTRLILEIKTSTMGKERSMALTERVLQTVNQLKAQAWVDYIAFDYDVCKKVKALNPDARVAYLYGDKSPEQLAADNLFGLDYHFSVLKKNEDWIADAQKRHLTVNVWTVNDRETLMWFLERHADFITTNEPELLLSLLAN